MRKGSLVNHFFGFTLIFAALMTGCVSSSSSIRQQESCTPDDSNLPTPCATSDQCGAGYECRGGICEHCSYAEHRATTRAFQPGIGQKNCKPQHVVTYKNLIPPTKLQGIRLSTTTSALTR